MAPTDQIPDRPSLDLEGLSEATRILRDKIALSRAIFEGSDQARFVAIGFSDAEDILGHLERIPRLERLLDEAYAANAVQARRLERAERAEAALTQIEARMRSVLAFRPRRDAVQRGIVEDWANVLRAALVDVPGDIDTAARIASQSPDPRSERSADEIAARLRGRGIDPGVRRRSDAPGEEIRQDDLPEHHRDDAPFWQCTVCGRKSWAREQWDERCAMPQPDGTACPGYFEPGEEGSDG